MIIYCRDRSIPLPRKRKQRFTPKQRSTVIPYRAEDHRAKPSVFERRCSNGVWVSRDRDADEQEAARILEELCS